MRISKVRIKNFRSILDLPTIEFGDLTVLIGKNDTGKSNIILALKKFFDQKASPEDLNKNHEGLEGYIEVCFEIDSKKSIFLDATKTKTTLAEENLLNEEGELDLIMEIGTQRQPKIKTLIKVLDFESADFSNLAQKKEEELNPTLMKYGLEFSGSIGSESVRSGRERTNKERRKMLRDYAEKKNHEKTEQKIKLDEDASSGLLREVKRIINEVSFNLYLGNTPLAISESQHQSSLRPLVGLAANSVLKDLSATKREFEEDIGRRLQDEIKEIGHLFREDTGLDLHFNVYTGNLQWDRIVKPDVATDEDGIEIPLSGRGLGTQRLFIMAMFRYLCQRLPKLDEEEYGHFVFAIEEPESFLHNNLQRRFFYSMLNLSKEDPQIILTTHSPVFSRISEQTRVYLTTRTPENGTKVTNIDVKNDYPTIKEELGIWNNDVFFDTAFLCVEGKTEKSCFPYIFQKLGCKPSELGIRLVDLEGQTKLDKMKELLRFAKGHGIAVTIFLDKHPENVLSKEDICRCPDFAELFPENDKDTLFKIWDGNFIDCFPREVVLKAVEIYTEKTMSELGFKKELENCSSNIENKIKELFHKTDGCPHFEKVVFGESVGKALLNFDCAKHEPLSSVNKTLKYITSALP